MTDEETKICSIDSLRKLSEKHPKLLLISAKENRGDFVQRFADEIARDDLTIVKVQTGGPCEVVEKLGLKDTPTAVLVEKGEVKKRIALQNDDVKDTVALINILPKPSEGKSCNVELVIDEKGWRLKPEPGSQCEKELSNISKLTPAVKKYVTKHLRE